MAAAAHQLGEPRSVSLSQTEHQWRRDQRDGVHSPDKTLHSARPRHQHPLVRPDHQDQLQEAGGGGAALGPADLVQGGGHQVGGECLLQAQSASAQPGPVHDEREGGLSDDGRHVLQQSSLGRQNFVQRLPDQTGQSSEQLTRSEHRQLQLLILHLVCLTSVCLIKKYILNSQLSVLC